LQTVTALLALFAKGRSVSRQRREKQAP